MKIQFRGQSRMKLSEDSSCTPLCRNMHAVSVEKAHVSISDRCGREARHRKLSAVIDEHVVATIPHC